MTPTRHNTTQLAGELSGRPRPCDWLCRTQSYEARLHGAIRVRTPVEHLAMCIRREVHARTRARARRRRKGTSRPAAPLDLVEGDLGHAEQSVERLALEERLCSDDSRSDRRTILTAAATASGSLRSAANVISFVCSIASDRAALAELGFCRARRLLAGRLSSELSPSYSSEVRHYVLVMLIRRRNRRSR